MRALAILLAALTATSAFAQFRVPGRQVEPVQDNFTVITNAVYDPTYSNSLQSALDGLDDQLAIYGFNADGDFTILGTLGLDRVVTFTNGASIDGTAGYILVASPGTNSSLTLLETSAIIAADSNNVQVSSSPASGAVFQMEGDNVMQVTRTNVSIGTQSSAPNQVDLYVTDGEDNFPHADLRVEGTSLATLTLDAGSGSTLNLHSGAGSLSKINMGPTNDQEHVQIVGWPETGSGFTGITVNVDGGNLFGIQPEGVTVRTDLYAYDSAIVYSNLVVTNANTGAGVKVYGALSPRLGLVSESLTGSSGVDFADTNATSGRILYGHTSDNMTFEAGGTEVFAIVSNLMDIAQPVEIAGYLTITNGANPVGSLRLYGGTAATIYTEAATASTLQLLSTPGFRSSVQMGSTNDPDAGSIWYDINNNTMQFYVGGSGTESMNLQTNYVVARVQLYVQDDVVAQDTLAVGWTNTATVAYSDADMLLYDTDDVSDDTDLYIESSTGNTDIWMLSGTNQGASIVFGTTLDAPYNDATITYTDTDGELTITAPNTTIDDALTLNPVAAPAVTNTGTIYYDSDDNKVKVWTGAAWENLN